MCVSAAGPHSIMCREPFTQMEKLCFDTVIQFSLGSKGTVGLHPFLYGPKSNVSFQKPSQVILVFPGAINLWLDGHLVVTWVWPDTNLSCTRIWSHELSGS